MCTMADARKPGYLVAACLLINLVLLAEAGTKWEEKSKTVQQGDTFSITCTLSDMRMMDIIRLIKENDGEESNQISISDMNVVKTPFLETNRYSVSINRKAKTVTLSFTGEGIRGEDGGRIGCLKLENEPTIAWIDLKVQVPVEDLYIASKDESGHETRVNHESDMVDLRENQEGGVLCRATVSGSLTPPTLRVLVEGEDKTDMFEAAPQSESKPNGGLPTYTSEMQLTYFNRKPDASFNGKKFECQADMEGFETRTVEAIFSVEYVPIVTCSKYTLYAVVGSPMTLACDVQSNPPATVSWKWGENHNIQSGQADEVNHLAAEEKMPAYTQALERADKKEVNLEISQVSADHLGSYTLTATNDYGKKEVTLELKKASAAPKVKPKPKEAEQGKQASGTAQDPQSVTGAGVGVGYNLWSLLVSLPLSIFILIIVT